MLRLTLSIAALFCLSSPTWAQSPVDTSSKLEEIHTEFDLADGPAWDGKSTLYVPDVKGETLYTFDPTLEKVTRLLSEAGRISASYYKHGQLYISDNARARIDILNATERTTLAVLDDTEKPQKRPNDLVVDAHKGVYVTLTRQNQVAYISADGSVSVAVDDVKSPNGITMSPDEKVLYVAAYVPKEIWSYDVTTAGKTANGQLLCKMDDGPDKGADGMTMDSAGNVYCAGPMHVWIWNAEGEFIAKIETPTRPINCAFGDADLKSLYITCFGGLYRQRMTVSGLSP